MTEPPSGAYYADRLSAERLRRCYEIAPPRVQRYLEAEIDFVRGFLGSGHRVLELGCGYGRVLSRLAVQGARLVGIDTSIASLETALAGTGGPGRRQLVAMDASCLAFADGVFDVVFCIQNGIAVFGVDRETLFDEAVRVTKSGGTVVFSSYSERFWPQRLAWFRLQAAHGLLGEIDEAATGDGVIVCKDGFRAETVDSNEFARLAIRTGLGYEVKEVDASSLFCVLDVSHRADNAPHPRGGMC